MGRLIEIQDALDCPASLTIAVGDLLQFSASGGHVMSGASLEMLGPFLPAVLAGNGEPLAPVGAPNTVLFLARRPGRAVIDVVVGDPWHAPRTVAITIDVKDLQGA
jgi:hypothetical protein